MRWPYVKISGFAPARPTNGLSGGTVPSSRMRRVLPTWVPRSCAFMRRLLSSVPVQQSRSRSPTVTYSVSSGPNRILPPKLPPVSQASATKISRTSLSCRPSNRPRATRERRAALAALRVRQIDELIRREPRVQREPFELVAGRDALGRPNGLGDELRRLESSARARCARRRASSDRRARARCSTDGRARSRP